MRTLNYFKTAIVAFSMCTLAVGCNQPIPVESPTNDDKFKNYELTLKENKALVTDFIKAMGASNVDKLKTMITDDFSWWIIGKPEYLSTAGEHDTAYFLGFFKGADLFPEGTDFKVTSVISEGNTVAAEAEFKARTVMGTDYENYYHFVFILENGKVKRMKEYMDTYNAKVTFGL